MTTNQKYAKAFNQWMDDFTNNPEKFESMTATALRHLRERSGGEEPSYGESSATVFEAYLSAQTP